MPLQPGTTLGPYEILSAIGAGGMGEVYKARDTRLDRTVAIKVLPEHVASDPDLKQRFEREAKTISSLNHPHICTLHDIGSQEGVDFLVMEYLEGDTLAQRLEKGALPLDQALTVAIEIADALDKAHRQGITHRDLKPGNIMLTTAGAKLLDFGLAKLKPGHDAPVGVSAPTVSAGLTGEGAILGTLQYMAPEQLEGQEADARTDIFAFGAVVYEMVTGEKTFAGKSQASLIAAILERDPAAMSAAQPLTPSALDRIIQKCLAKDPEERWHSTHDLHDELQWITERDPATVSQSDEAVPAQPAARRPTLAFAVGLAAVAAVVAGLGVWGVTRSEPVDARPVRFGISVPPPAQLQVALDSSDVAISPDGHLVAYFTGNGALLYQPSQLLLRSLSDFTPTTLASGSPLYNPFFSPDGGWVGFYDLRDLELRRVSVQGGSAVPIADLDGAMRGASWGEDDMIVFATRSGLWRVAASGGVPERLTTPDGAQGELGHFWPEILPGGRAVLFTVIATLIDDSQIEVLSLATGERTVLVRGGFHGRYAPTGHVLYGVGTTVRAVRFDLDRLEVTGGPVAVVDEVLTKQSGVADFSLSANGSLVYVSGTAAAGDTRTLVWVDRDGREEAVPAPPAPYASPRISPDGRSVALVVEDGRTADVMVYDLERDTPSPLTFDPGQDRSPLWSPDGQRVVFSSNRDGTPNVYTKAADGTGQAERLTTSDKPHVPMSWSADGQSLVLTELVDAQGDLTLFSLDAEPRFEALVATDATEAFAQVSPDGRWMAYVSDESGQFEVYVRPFPNVDDARWRISRDGGLFPAWAPDGRELFFRSTASTDLMGVTVETDPTFAAGNPEVVLVAPNSVGRPLHGRSWDVSPDGERFLFVRERTPEDAPGDEPHLVFVEHWFEELTARVPTN